MANIPFIYNYCDRWCEKCLFVDRCSVGSQDMNFNNESMSLNNDDFWKFIQDQYVKAIDMLQQFIKEEGITITESIEAQTKSIEDNPIDRVDFILENNELAILAKQYAKDVGNIIEKTPFLDEVTNSAEQFLNLGITTLDEVKSKMALIQTNVQTIQWYRFLIFTKFMRALTSLDDDNDEVQSDNNGSAKVAMLAVESSLGAWYTLYNDGHQDNEDILNIMAKLDKILRLANHYFPDARKFVRPGFDAGWQELWS